MVVVAGGGTIEGPAVDYRCCGKLLLREQSGHCIVLDSPTVALYGAF